VRKLPHRLAQFSERSFVFSREFKQHADVINHALLIFSRTDYFFDARALLQNFLRRRLIVPEIGRGGSFLELL
jgi:hypothetical protein